MKTKNFEKRLILKKNTVSHLNSRELGKVLGGSTNYFTCTPCDTWMETCIPCPFRETFGTAC